MTNLALLIGNAPLGECGSRSSSAMLVRDNEMGLSMNEQASVFR